MNSKVQIAIDALMIRLGEFSKAEKDALSTIKLVLIPAGEHGASLAPLDYTDGIHVPVAEVEPQVFKPITLIRYWKGRLEVFVSDYEQTEDMGWKILPDGKWVLYEDASVDTWFLLDVLMENIEYSDGYQD